MIDPGEAIHASHVSVRLNGFGKNGQLDGSFRQRGGNRAIIDILITPSSFPIVLFNDNPVSNTNEACSSLINDAESSKAQSVSPLAPLGIEAALKAKEDASFVPRPKIFDEFALTDRVGLVSGGNRGLGLEMAIAFAEAGARVVHCVDLPEEPSEEFQASRDYVSKLGNGSRLEYFSADVRNQQLLWKKAEEIGDKEQRFDFCVAAAGILKPNKECLEYPAEEFREVSGHGRIGDADLPFHRCWM